MKKRKLSPRQAEELRHKYKKGAHILDLCEEYNLTQSPVYCIINNETYKTSTVMRNIFNGLNWDNLFTPDESTITEIQMNDVRIFIANNNQSSWVL